jgi:hypothetical protein
MRTRRSLRVLGAMMSLGLTFAVGPMRPAGARGLEHPVATIVRHHVSTSIALTVTKHGQVVFERHKQG